MKLDPNDRKQPPVPDTVSLIGPKCLLPTAITSAMTTEQLDAYMTTAIKTIPKYQPLPGYRRPTSFSIKVYVPVNDYPGVNFIGQILDPRGSSLRTLNTKSGASIALHGKGSVKEGRGQVSRSRAAADHLGESLHCPVTPSLAGRVNRAKELIQVVIATAASTLEHENDRKRQQLRDLAMINENWARRKVASYLGAPPSFTRRTLDYFIRAQGSAPPGAGAISVSKRAT
ncbi:hypothetical protein HRG_008445 [Hirsutella rhossiliensis]|uniref:Branchpoint-bridging protein n=1 Tax=Hirsutella rhossiliensis TaxID=111463 RepID=A0A9P8SGB3_9HYPO|nr:uncharacterized protein HRG_08445 [Hirsutella rhossiliensis]KAH0960290.1 hypothetical protein HRG_08445 [Hirsutella rhossiliensis]